MVSNKLFAQLSLANAPMAEIFSANNGIFVGRQCRWILYYQIDNTKQRTSASEPYGDVF